MPISPRPELEGVETDCDMLEESEESVWSVRFTQLSCMKAGDFAVIEIRQAAYLALFRGSKDKALE